MGEFLLVASLLTLLTCLFSNKAQEFIDNRFLTCCEGL